MALLKRDAFLHRYGPTIDWLLETDPEQPAVRYFTLRDLLDLPDDDGGVRASKEQIGRSGPVVAILQAQHSEGYWVQPGAGYSPKYTGTVWQLMFLAQFGADGSDDRVRRACEYVLSHTRASNGIFSATGSPSGFIHCLSGNLLSALLDLGSGGTHGRAGSGASDYARDDRVREMIELQARFVTGAGIATAHEKIAPRYYRSGTTGPHCACANNNRFHCAWGAIKTLTTFGKIPAEERSEQVHRAIEQSVSLLLSHDPALARYPSVYGETPSSNWFKFGYPLGYTSDVLHNVEALTRVGMISDPRLAGAIRSIESKRTDKGRWIQEYQLKSPTWFQQEPLGKPSKWVTLRALRVLKAADGSV